MSGLIETCNISKTYLTGPLALTIFQDLNLRVDRHDFLAIMGPSGSGKSTLLNIIGCLDRPSSGVMLFNGRDITKASDRGLSSIRANRIGFVFQTFHLVSHLNTYENVALPFLYSSHGESSIRERTLNAIEHVGLTHRLRHKPSELSGGEMQRVAIARALAVQPDVILADEPTGNLDAATSSIILDLFKSLHAGGATIVIVTHDKEVANRAEKTVIFREGRLVW